MARPLTNAYDPDRHLGLVVSSWLHSYRQSPWARLMHPATYTQTQRAAIDGLIAGPMYTGARGAVPQLILSSADNGTVIAWSLWETVPRHILHYVWVAQPLRKSGFASRILREHGADRHTVVSHWSDAAQRCFDGSQEIRQLFSATNSHHPRYSPTLTANPNAFVAM